MSFKFAKSSKSNNFFDSKIKIQFHFVLVGCAKFLKMKFKSFPPWVRTRTNFGGNLANFTENVSYRCLLPKKWQDVDNIFLKKKICFFEICVRQIFTFGLIILLFYVLSEPAPSVNWSYIVLSNPCWIPKHRRYLQNFQDSLGEKVI